MSLSAPVLSTGYDHEVTDKIAECFTRSLDTADRRDTPYAHWLMQETLPSATVDAITSLPFAAPEDMDFNGRRETNNSKRVYFTKTNQDQFPVCRECAVAFNSSQVRETIRNVTGADLTGAALRIEYCQDTGDFWLEPHTDIKVKKFTLLIYLSDEPALANCGTDVYDDTPQHKLVYSAPYAKNKAILFIPGANTWHGFSKRRINGIRKSLIVNYVAPEWRDTWELSY
ncbi:MAG TPA: hypothetical protein VFT64_09540 [Rickettsiales bacterium]|nr:hypothetical protein [Rickettsiales bacterium]